MAKEFNVLAGKYDDYEGEQIENIKFAGTFDSLEKAEMIISERQLNQYPFCRVEITGY